ncbi:trypsin-like peptidase domain-containing protein [Bradyrhizobium sp. Tv2a-2]|uniref:S1C family serine protease n=1 Tax=Bradyrhizobium sp. Tv2a-2 TaxID=113395 RepID=UPI0004667733|nr:trypsin-like peptidase domain-containing protein [Bradyrhizobium sp. Tv2a-2]
MLRRLFVACGLLTAFACSTVSSAQAAGPYGTIHVGNWIGGAFSDDSTGAFSHCAATTSYASGVSLVIGQNIASAWLLGFASPDFKLNTGDQMAIDVTFDGQSQARLFATASSSNMVIAILPASVARTFQRSSLMVAQAGKATLQFNLTSTGPLLAVIATCVAKVKADGLNSAGDFAKVAARSAAAGDGGNGTPAAPKTSRSADRNAEKNVGKSGTGFVISASGHILTNNHVIDGCTDIRGNLSGQPVSTLRVVSNDSQNDLALLQGPAASFKDYARIRDRSVHSGDSVVAIGYPFHGLLTSDFTVTTGIVSSLSGLWNDTRFLQISAAVQPGNSGGPLFDTSGLVTGVVTGKLDGLSMVRRTGDIPENINFAIKTGAIRDFLDNSVVPYETAAPGGELKTPEIAEKARGFTLLITCTGKEPVEAKR